MNEKKIPDAEIVSEEKHDTETPVQVVEVVEAREHLRFHSQTRHALRVEWIEDEHGDYDIYISDVASN